MKIGNIKINTVPLSQANTTVFPKAVYPCPIELFDCPICGNTLRDYVLAVPVSNKECTKIRGDICHKCDALFSTSTKLLNGLEKIRQNKSSYKLNKSYDISFNFPYYSNLRNKIKSTYCQITLCAPEDIRIYTIVMEKNDSAIEKGILHYLEPLALDLLTAITMNEKAIELSGKRFALSCVKYLVHANSNPLLIIKPSCRVVVILKQNGGYYFPDDNMTLLHGLVFSEKSNRLEALPISYSSNEDIYFVDRRVYNDFAKIYGLPIFTHVSRSKGEWSELRAESLLHQLGYNASASSDLTASERQAMLGRFVDLGFVTVHSIVTLLTSLIRRNGIAHAHARDKWKNDLEFISNYKVNPERFVFVSKIRRL